MQEIALIGRIERYGRYWRILGGLVHQVTSVEAEIARALAPINPRRRLAELCSNSSRRSPSLA